MPREQDGEIMEIEALAESLRKNPTTLLKCTHDICPDWAVCVCHVPKGCVAMPGIEVQALCLQHIQTDGSFEGLFPYIDLTLNAALSIDRGYGPKYCLVKEGDAQEPVVMSFEDYLKLRSG